jgi:hypothetical protein
LTQHFWLSHVKVGCFICSPLPSLQSGLAIHPRPQPPVNLTPTQAWCFPPSPVTGSGPQRLTLVPYTLGLPFSTLFSTCFCPFVLSTTPAAIRARLSYFIYPSWPRPVLPFRDLTSYQSVAGGPGLYPSHPQSVRHCPFKTVKEYHWSLYRPPVCEAARWQGEPDPSLDLKSRHPDPGPHGIAFQRWNVQGEPVTHWHSRASTPVIQPAIISLYLLSTSACPLLEKFPHTTQTPNWDQE